MRNLVYFAVIVSFLFASCASSKLAKQEDTKNLTEFSLGMIENFNITPDMLYKMQFFSGSDTIVLQKSTKVATGSVASDGTLMLVGGNPSKKHLILPYTPGTVSPKGIILGSDKKVKEILVAFSDNENNTISFFPSNDEYGVFMFNKNKKTVFKEEDENPDQPLMIKLFYTEQQDQLKVEPGRFVDQKMSASALKKLKDKN